MVVYAFNRHGDRVETLERHILVGLNFLHEIYIKRGYAEHVARRLNIPCKVAETILKTAYALHDIGKAYDPYQQLIIKGKGAPGHETLSAYIVLKHLNIEIGLGKELDDQFRKGIALAIMLHHHAMRSIWEALNSLCKVVKQHPKYTLSTHAQTYLVNIYSILNIQVNNPTNIKPSIIIETILKKLAKTMKAQSNERRTYNITYLTLHPLITCDVLAAATSKYNCNNTQCLKQVRNEIPKYVTEYLKAIKIL